MLNYDNKFIVILCTIGQTRQAASEVQSRPTEKSRYQMNERLRMVLIGLDLSLESVLTETIMTTTTSIIIIITDIILRRD